VLQPCPCAPRRRPASFVDARANANAQSPYAAYNGRQAYVVHAQASGNRVSSAVVGLIAGGKDFALVTNMCAKYGLDPTKRQLADCFCPSLPCEGL
jgi:hypothetical protein